MFKESLLDKILYQVKKLIPRSVFGFFQPMYHAGLAWAGAVIYGFPSRSMKVIGVTGTKGKSTTVYLISKILELALQPVQGERANGIAAIGSLGFKIKEREWPNTLKMTMPGRFRLQKFLSQAKKAGCRYVVLEVTSEGIKQKRHLGIQFDCAVFTNLHKEHIENHGSFENYAKAKQELFKRTKNTHVLNADDSNIELFSQFEASKKVFFGLKRGDIIARNVKVHPDHSSFDVYGTKFNINFGGEFNVLNCLAALSTAAMYGIDLPKARPILENIKKIPGRMDFVQKEPFKVVVDYAHTPDSLEQVYQTLKSEILNSKSETNPKSQIQNPKLICVLGAAGGGRDKWKRQEFGKIASQYCDEIILTNEDPYDENPETIIREIASGFSSQLSNHNLPTGQAGFQFSIIEDRHEAIKKAISLAQPGDTVIITGKGSENSMAISGGKKIPWSDRQVVKDILKAY